MIKWWIISCLLFVVWGYLLNKTNDGVKEACKKQITYGEEECLIRATE